MRRLSLTLLATTAAVGLAAMSQVATAADLPRKAPPPMVAPPPPLWNWTGFYLGGHLGVGISRNQFSNGACSTDFHHAGDLCTDVFDPATFGTSSSLGSHNGLGVLGGVQVGYNWQFPNSPLVVGIEGTYTFADLKGDHQNGVTLVTDGGIVGQERLASRTKGIATITGRLGLASGPQDRTLWYVKGGGAWRNTTISANGSYIFDLSSDRDPLTTSFDGKTKRWGWTVGTGVEFGLFDNWSAKIEYNYLDFGTKDIAFNGTACSDGDSCGGVSRNVSLKQQIHMVTVGLNYRFNWLR